MQKIIFILLLFTYSLFAQESITGLELSIYKTTNKHLGLKNIERKKQLFVKMKEDEKLEDKDAVYWLQLKTNGLLEEGEYFISYGNMDFDISSFISEQKPYKFMQGLDKTFRFFYCVFSIFLSQK